MRCRHLASHMSVEDRRELGTLKFTIRAPAQQRQWRLDRARGASEQSALSSSVSAPPWLASQAVTAAAYATIRPSRDPGQPPAHRLAQLVGAGMAVHPIMKRSAGGGTLLPQRPDVPSGWASAPRPPDQDDQRLPGLEAKHGIEGKRAQVECLLRQPDPGCAGRTLQHGRHELPAYTSPWAAESTKIGLRSLRKSKPRPQPPWSTATTPKTAGCLSKPCTRAVAASMDG